MLLTEGRGVDVAIEALGTQSTFEACMRVLRPAGRCPAGRVLRPTIPLGPFAAGLAITDRDDAVPGGRAMRRLMSVIAAAVSTCGRW